MADAFEEMEGSIGSVFGSDVSEAVAQRLQRLDINELTYRMSWGSDDFDQNTKESSTANGYLDFLEKWLATPLDQWPTQQVQLGTEMTFTPGGRWKAGDQNAPCNVTARFKAWSQQGVELYVEPEHSKELTMEIHEILNKKLQDNISKCMNG